MARIIIGLPTLSRGPLLDAAIDMKAPVMVSATALSKWEDDGPVPPGYEFTPMEMRIRMATGDRRPPTPAQRRRRMRIWRGWNTGMLDRVMETGLSVHLDSAGFVAMARFNGWFWSPEDYVFGLAAHPAIERFSSMDLCVEVEVAPDRSEVRERIAKTINLNRQCRRLADEAGIAHKFMPVIQGVCAEDYLRCFDAISCVVSPGATIGVGSMCRRPTRGPEGSTAIMEVLDRELPKDVRLHLFGIKSDGAEAACMFGDRIDSVDSQAYGIRARKLANEERAKNPFFSKTNLFTAGVMRSWYEGQTKRMAKPRVFPLQGGMDFGGAENRPKRVIDALEMVVRTQFNDLIIEGQLDHDQIVCGRMLEESVYDLAGDLPDGVGMTDAWEGSWQLPKDVADMKSLPDVLLAA